MSLATSKVDLDQHLNHPNIIFLFFNTVHLNNNQNLNSIFHTFIEI